MKAKGKEKPKKAEAAEKAAQHTVPEMEKEVPSELEGKKANEEAEAVSEDVEAPEAKEGGEKE